MKSPHFVKYFLVFSSVFHYCFIPNCSTWFYEGDPQNGFFILLPCSLLLFHTVPFLSPLTNTTTIWQLLSRIPAELSTYAQWFSTTLNVDNLLVCDRIFPFFAQILHFGDKSDKKTGYSCLWMSYPQDVDNSVDNPQKTSPFLLFPLKKTPFWYTIIVDWVLISIHNLSRVIHKQSLV